MTNPLLTWMRNNSTPLTVENYISLNWCGDKTFDQLEGEDRAEVESLIEDGVLYIETSGSKDMQ